MWFAQSMSALRALCILTPPVLPTPPPPPPPPRRPSASFFSSSSSRSPPTSPLRRLRLGLAAQFVAPRRWRTRGPETNRGPAMSDSNLSVTADLDCSGSDQSVPIGRDYTEIVVVRHGETEWNADGRIQGHLDVELNEIGRQQATAVGQRLSREGKISAIYSSDLKRAFETATVIATACGGLEIIQDPDLRERNLGELQGLQLHAASSVCPLAYKAFLSNKTDQEIPGGGESIDQLYQRCTTCLESISTKHKGERIVVVTHGGVIRSLHRRACPRQRGGKVLNSSVNIFHLSNGDNWILKSWGDISRLSQTEYLGSGFGGDRSSAFFIGFFLSVVHLTSMNSCDEAFRIVLEKDSSANGSRFL